MRIEKAARVSSSASELLAAAGVRVKHVLELAGAEAKLATTSGLSMLLLMMFASASLIIAWALIVATAIYLTARAGVPWSIVALVFAALHAGLAFACWRSATKLSRNLTLPRLRSVLAPRRATSYDSGEHERDGPYPVPD